MSSKLLEHLQCRPIASIVNLSRENDSSSMLKLISLLDYELETSNLYEKILPIPKLPVQLLTFQSLASFKYFSYKLPKYLFGDKLLKCKVCHLVGPYATVLEHMATNHNLHANAKICMWCERTIFKMHISQNTINQCYGIYLRNHNLNNVKCPKAIKSFYKLLKRLATELNVKISRSESFRSTNKNNNDTNANEMIVFTSQHDTQREINLVALESMYQRAMMYFNREELHEYLVFDTSVNGKSQLEQGNGILTGNGISAEQSNTSENLTIEIDPVHVDISLSPARFASPHSTVHFNTPQPSPQLEATSSPVHVQQKTQPSLQKSSGQVFQDFITSSLSNIEDEELREKAKSEIQRLVADFLAQDIINDMKKNQQKQ